VLVLVQVQHVARLPFYTIFTSTTYYYYEVQYFGVQEYCLIRDTPRVLPNVLVLSVALPGTLYEYNRRRSNAVRILLRTVKLHVEQLPVEH
jgi:hypothetical protein